MKIFQRMSLILLLAIAAQMSTLTPVGAQQFRIPQSLQGAIAPDAPVFQAMTPPSAARAPEQAIAAATATNCVASSFQPAPIVALALALKCDPDLIFEYVYNNIDYEPLYGSKKGALGTLLDRRGNDADQALLLVALWNAAGYSAAGYSNGLLPLTGSQLANWLGVTNNAISMLNLLSAGGIPWIDAVINGDGTLQVIKVLHFVAAINLNSTWYYFDPSYKFYSNKSGIDDLSEKLGYTRSVFLDAVGGIIDSVSISNISRSNLRTHLISYSSNLINYVRENNQTMSLGDIVGGRVIQQLANSPVRVSYSLHVYSVFPDICPNLTPAISCRGYINIKMPGATDGQAIKLYTDEVYGRRITVFSSQSGANYLPTLLIDGTPPSCLPTCTNVGPAIAAGQPWAIGIQDFETNLVENAACGVGVGATACTTLTVAAGGSYLIALGAGQVGRSMAEYHRQLLQQKQAAGGSPTSEAVLGESLSVIGYNWLAQVAGQQQIGDRLGGATTLYRIGMGIVGQSGIQSTGAQGPYVDLPLNFVHVIPQTNGGASIEIGPYSYSAAFISAGLSISQALSSFESSVLTQMQASVPGMTAASTINIIDNNMNASYAGALQKTFFADGTTSTGRSTYTASILPNINTHYASADLSAITALVNGGAQILIPQNGQLPVGLWTGAGYTSIFPQSESAITITQKISGGLSGGFAGANIPTSTLSQNNATAYVPPASTASVTPIVNTTPSPANPQIAEPIDGISGAYVYNHDDLVLGGGSFPYALPFSRTYLSSSGGYLSSTTANKGIGNGWMHTYGSTAQAGSDPYVGLGSTTTPAVSAATTIVALFVMKDLMSITPTAQTLTVSSMVARWLADQLTNNIVTVSQPDTTEAFASLPRPDDASTFTYNAPLGSSVRLTQTGAGQYSYLTKAGVLLNFGPTPEGALQSWVAPNGVSVNLTYSGGQLASVSNNLGRSLTLSYSGGNVTSVTDGTGRSVQFAYDTHNNLIGYTSPSGAVTRYQYDISGEYDTLGRLAQVYYPSTPGSPFLRNWYDPLGRVAQQADANGNTWSFYFAGSRSETVDPLGGRNITYQTDRGKVLSDYRVLDSAAAGTIFYSTPQQNNVVNLTTHQYDGLDRLTLTRFPERGTTAYTYETALNPWANNIRKITRTAKPGSPLAALSTTFRYDPIYNKPAHLTGPRGLATQMSYDAATGNLLAVTADANNLRATARFTYNAKGQVLAATDPMGVVTQNSYDSFGNLTATVLDCCGAGHINQTTSLAYDIRGDVVALTDPKGNVTRSTYDSSRRLVTLSQPAAPTSLVTSFFYDADGRLLNTQQSSNGNLLQQVSSSYTPTGKVATTTDANGNVTRYAYDANEQLKTITDPLFRVTSYGYDAVNRPIAIANPGIQAGPLVRYAYTPDGAMARLTDARGYQTNFAYDGFDRLSTTTYPDSSTETLSYDNDSNILARKTRANVTISYAYDTLNRRITKSVPSAPTVTYVYDLDSRLISVSDTSAVMQVATTGMRVPFTFNYDAMNRLVGTSFSPVQAQAPPTASSTTFNFTYDATNRRLTQSTNDSSWWSTPSTASSTLYATNDLNQYTAVGGVSQAYDGNGNLTSDGTFTYAYDAESRLISAAGSGVTASYSYDAQGRRKSKTVNGSTTIFVQDPDNRALLDYDGATGAVQSWYALGLGPNDVLARSNAAGTARTTFIPDILSSVVGTLDAGTGLLTKAGFQTFGESTAANGSFRYTGARLDAETGLYDFRARIYAPKLGRFMQVDPIGYVDGVNLYAYVNNDPLNFLDSFGLAAERPSIGKGLLQSIVNAVPGAYYAGLAIGEFQQGNYGSAAVYGGISLGDTMLSIVPFGIGTRALGAAERIVPASTPIGRLGNPINVVRGTNEDVTIGSRLFSGHALDQMQGRGVPSSVVENAIKIGASSPDPIPGRMRYYDVINNITVITELSGRVITVITGRR